MSYDVLGSSMEHDVIVMFHVLYYEHKTRRNTHFVLACSLEQLGTITTRRFRFVT